MKQAHLTAFYKKYLSQYEINTIDYNTPDGKELQLAGIDKILIKRNEQGEVIKQHKMQEKVCNTYYSKLMFEYQKKSGKEGWAIAEDEQSDYLIYYHGGHITLLVTSELRGWLRDNLKRFIALYRYDTDNKNVNVPRSVIKANIRMWEFELEDYYTEKETN